MARNAECRRRRVVVRGEDLQGEVASVGGVQRAVYVFHVFGARIGVLSYVNAKF
jgi:hypothetical protein